MWVDGWVVLLGVLGGSICGEDMLMCSMALISRQVLIVKQYNVLPASCPSGPTIAIVISPRFAMRFTVNDIVS